MTENSSGETVWKNIAMFLAGALLAGGGSVIALARDSISRTEVNQQIHEVYQRMDDQTRSINNHLENIDRTQVETSKDVVGIAARLGVSRSASPHPN